MTQLIPIANSIVKNFGENTEVVLHDLKTPENSIIYIARSVTNRESGGPVTNFVLEALKTGKEMLECYKTIIKDGKILRCTTTFVRNQKNEVIGCMCINFDITDYLHSKRAVEKLTFFPEIFEEKKDNCNELFENDIMSIIEQMVAQTVESFGKPIEVLNKR